MGIGSFPYGCSWIMSQDGSMFLDTKRVRGFRRELGFGDPDTGQERTQIIARYGRNDDEVLAEYLSPEIADAALRGLNAALINGDVAGFAWPADEAPDDLPNPFA